MPFSLTGDLPDTSGARRARPGTSSTPDDTESVSGSGSDAADTAIIIDPVEIPPPFFVFETLREDLRDDAGNLIGHRDVTNGFGWSSVVEYDAALNFVGSEYRDSSGYRSTTRRETLTDATGIVAGYVETSSGSGGGFFYESTVNYDANSFVVSSRHSDSSGYTSSTTRTELLDEAGNLTGYRVEGSGNGNGFSFESTEEFDARYMLVRSTYSDGNGYRSTYNVETLIDATGAITGYVTHSTWTDGVTDYSTTDRFDAAWNYLGGDSQKPDIVIDDGPAVLPVVARDTADVSGETLAATRASAPSIIDGSNQRGAKLKSSSGDDTFYVDDGGDGISGSSKGIDTLMSDAISLNLARKIFKGIENATLIGSKDLNLRGSNGANVLSGNGGDNRINGGTGTDTLFGGLGDDIFVITGGQRGKADRITDFTRGEDGIALSGRDFGTLFGSQGRLRDGVLGDRLLFDAETGELSYDRDGSAGKAGAKVVAVLVGVSELDANDFTTG